VLYVLMYETNDDDSLLYYQRRRDRCTVSASKYVLLHIVQLLNMLKSNQIIDL